jgi:hypothetical protein
MTAAAIDSRTESLAEKASFFLVLARRIILTKQLKSTLNIKKISKKRLY